MKLELTTKSKEHFEQAKQYCDNNNLVFVDMGTFKILGHIEYLYDIIGTSEQIRKYEDSHNIVY